MVSTVCECFCSKLMLIAILSGPAHPNVRPNLALRPRPCPALLRRHVLRSKTDSSPVTVADFTVQALVLGVLSRYFPGHGFIAEESSSVLRQDPESLSHVLSVVRTVLGRQGLEEAELCAAIDLGTRGHGKNKRGRRGKGGRTWVLDPIDGTKGFLRGEQFCVALVRKEGVKRGVGHMLGRLLPLRQACFVHVSQIAPTAGRCFGRCRWSLYTPATTSRILTPGYITVSE